MKTYTVVEPLTHLHVHYSADAAIELDDFTAAQLLKAGMVAERKKAAPKAESRGEK